MRRTLTDTEFQQQVEGWTRSALRAELQPHYWVASERASFEWWLAAKPEPGPEIPGTKAWLERTRQRAAHGIHLHRIRIHQDPPTDYQRWAKVVSAEYEAAGDRIDYLTVAQADSAGLLGVAARDWWLFDDERLVVLTHNPEGRRIHTELVTDEPELNRARAWWDLAVHTTRGENA
ncbi:DUF6879 family protein [Actinoplanes sp. NPDC023936]|uniref:DUF6879 family protein n=1 Tax=Actinoplanes sp. NPDC023936 TaxID=3154910 RepID=UPI00340A09B0